jgi:transcription elongation factor GreA-like protein
MDVIEKVRRESIERAFINLINEMSDEWIQRWREWSLTMTNIEQAQLWFTKVNCFKRPEVS